MVDCSLLTYKNFTYLLPTLAIAEAIILPAGFILKRDASIVGAYEWQQVNCAILTIDLLPLNDLQIKNPKIALLHSTQSQTLQPFFAILFEGQTRRLKISLENINWADESKKTALVSEKKTHTQVILVDLMALSKEAELIPGQTQVSK